ncbi:MAG: LysR family transcriptional regulator [Sphingomonas sp.]|uniref:LysR substrate-binding domain-containing protein n=1 Tax=Sphingomonas sp. TaxID=28214 RepID=UPI001AD58829|nr:LysR substrate-binding domain-containing protein [Sphingomonas sp.]MBN8808449.1 LysR family transcriptional regulator [Sphingomonas sp.]
MSALRAFEAAARLGSFQLAAQEMSLTPSAISYQIRNLETTLGQPLFVRQHRKVSLTSAGDILNQFVQRGFNELRNGAAAVQQVRNPRVLRMTCAPAFANAFLTHRIRAFELANPQLELQLVVAHSVMDLVADGLDVAIRFSINPPADLYAKEIADLAYTPICVPALAENLHTVDDLLQAKRVLVREHAQGWTNWFAGTGRTVAGGRELQVETLNVSVQAALDGLGISLLPRVIVASHLAAGRLVAPFDHDLISQYKYWFACRRGEEHTMKIRRIERWLRDEIKTPHLPPIAA